MNPRGKDYVYKKRITTGQKEITDYEWTCDKTGKYNATAELVHCYNKEVGSYYVDIYDYIDFDFSEITKGELVVGVFTKVSVGEHTEWIPTIAGERIEEWGDFLGASRYEYNVVGDDGDNALTANRVLGQTFTIGSVGTNESFNLIGASFKFWKAGAPADLNISLFEMTNGTTSGEISKVIATNTSIDISGFSAVSPGTFQNISLPSVALYNNVTYYLAGQTTAGDLNMRVSSSNTYDGGHRYYTSNGGVDWSFSATSDYMFEIWGTTASHTTISANTILISPEDNLKTEDTTIQFKSNSTLTGFGNFSNATLTVWKPDNSIFGFNITILNGTFNATNLSLSNFITGSNYKWNVLYCGTNSSGYVCEQATANRTFSVFPFTEVSNAYSNGTTEGNLETYELNISISGGLQISSANLRYNKTTNFGTISNKGGGNYTLTESLVAHSVEATKNLTFYWQLEFSNGLQLNTTTSNQTVKNIAIDDCTLYNELILNYTIRDEESQLNLSGVGSNTTIEVDVDISAVGTTIPIIQFSQNYTKINPARVCLANDTLASNANIKYRMDVVTRYVSDDRISEFHHLQNFLLKNSSIPQNINLYDLLIVDSQEFLITYKDSSFIPVEGALIDIQRKYIDEGVFKSVEVVRTDSKGQAPAHFVLSDVIYTIIVSREGVVLDTYPNVIAVCQNTATNDCNILLNSFSAGTSIQDFTAIEGLTYSFTFDPDARTIVLVFTTNDGSSKTIFLNSTKYDRFGNNTICTDTLVSSSGTLTCNIPQSFGNVTILSELYSNGNLVTTRIYNIASDFGKVFGGTKNILILMMLLTLPFIFIASTIGMIFGILVGLLFANLLGLFEGGSIMNSSSVIIWLIVAGLIIIWKLSREETF